MTTTLPVMVSVVNAASAPQASLPVYAFDGTTYTGYNKTTNAGGQAVFTLPQGSYHFRADKSGTQFWSETANATCPPMTVTAGDSSRAIQHGLGSGCPSVIPLYVR